MKSYVIRTNKIPIQKIFSNVPFKHEEVWLKFIADNNWSTVIKIKSKLTKNNIKYLISIQKEFRKRQEIFNMKNFTLEYAYLTKADIKNQFIIKLF